MNKNQDNKDQPYGVGGGGFWIAFVILYLFTVRDPDLLSALIGYLQK